MRIPVLFALVLPLLAFVSPAAAQPENPRGGEVSTAVDYAVRLLEAKDYERMLEEFIEPEEKKQLLQFTTIKELAPKFAKLKAADLLRSLKEIQGTTPKLSEDGNKATFALKEPVGGKQAVVFLRVGKLWYIGN